MPKSNRFKFSFKIGIWGKGGAVLKFDMASNSSRSRAVHTLQTISWDIAVFVLFWETLTLIHGKGSGIEDGSVLKKILQRFMT